jgi:hypothetical protein
MIITLSRVQFIFYFQCYTVKLHAFGHQKPYLKQYGEESIDRGIPG